jgi:peptide chain release factor 3
MNPKHRDSMAFLRVCSGVFEREMVVKHHRLNKDIRLARSYSLVARDRNTVDVAYPGDVIGAINPGTFAIGDTISLSGGFNFKPMPRFPPEVMAQIRPTDVLRRKSFEKGMLQLSHEGAIQVLRSFENPESAPFIAAVGKLQFDVLQFRLKEEYTVETHLDMMPYKYGAYVIGDPRTLKKTQSSYLATDSDGRVLVLYPNEWEKRFIEERSPEHKLVEFVQG